MKFTNGYADAPVCAPTRACLISGQYSPRHGVYRVTDVPALLQIKDCLNDTNKVLWSLTSGFRHEIRLKFFSNFVVKVVSIFVFTALY